jgi:hypothetical protein
MKTLLPNRLTDFQMTIAQYLANGPASKENIDAHMGRKMGPSLNGMVTVGAVEMTDGVYRLTAIGRAELATSLSRSSRWSGHFT